MALQVFDNKDLIDILRPEFRQSVRSSGDADQTGILFRDIITEASDCFGDQHDKPHGSDDKGDQGKQPWRRSRCKVFPEAREPKGITETRQQRAVRRLRSRLSLYAGHQIYGSAVLMSDQELLLWLELYDLNVFMTQAKLLKHWEVRTRENMDQLVNDYKPPNALAYHYPGGLCGTALDGSLILYEMPGNLQLRNFILTASRKEIHLFMLHRWERIRQAAIKSGTYQVLVIFDVRGITKRSLTGCVPQVVREILGLFQENYLWMIKEVIILNRSPIAQELYLGLRPYISRKFASRTTLLGDNNFLKYLCQKVARYEIPAFLGGYRCDIDNNPYCRQDLNWQNDIPVWTRMTNQFLTAEVEDLSILGGERLTKDYHVALPQSRLIYQFLHLSQPVEFSIYLNDRTDDKCLRQRSVIKPQDSIPSEVIVCKSAGHYLFVFDNWRHLATKFTGVIKVLLSPPNYVTSKYAAREPLGHDFDMSRPVGPEEMKLRRKNGIDDRLSTSSSIKTVKI